MNYKINPIGKPKFSFPANGKDLENFKFEPRIRCAIQYSDQGKIVARLNVIYSLTCFFPKKSTREPFASAQQNFEIIKNDELDLPYKSETTFKCVKEVEEHFDDYLRSRNPPVQIIGTLLKRTTFQSWMTKGDESSNDFELN